MRDLSLHLLDLVQNSVTAGAKHVSISLELDGEGMLTITLKDDGSGMSKELLARVTSPFSTTRTTRKVGLGIPLIQQNARLTGGDVTIESVLGEGTTLTATFDTRSIDCLPLGDVPETIASLVLANPVSPEFSLRCVSPGGSMTFSTEELRAQLPDVPLNEPEVIAWITDTLREEIQPIMGGITL